MTVAVPGVRDRVEGQSMLAAVAQRRCDLRLECCINVSIQAHGGATAGGEEGLLYLCSLNM